MNEKYNGWANYETWLTNSWLTEWRLTAADFLTDEDISNNWLSDLVSEVKQQ